MNKKMNESQMVYLDRYITTTNKLKKMKKRIDKLNRIYARENFQIDEHGNLVLKEGNQRICNFFVYPTHKLYLDDGSSLEINGVGIVAFAKIEEEKYKEVYLNLSFDLIESGDWVKSEYLDTDYDLIKSSQYSYLKSALKIATRRIGKYDVKIFNGEEWIEDKDASDLLNEYQDHLTVKRIWENNKQSQGLEQDVLYYLNAILDFTKENKLTQYGEEPISVDQNFGWESSDMYFLMEKKFREWLESRLKSDNHELVSSKNDINSYLMDKDIIRYDREKSGRIRLDTWATVYPGHKKKFYCLNKEKLFEFLEKQQN